ncbi:MAG: 50S ribosomal protein L29 [Candidatus Omnitrophica bacterium]|nr:50S ribosomal protein L29 [Candidatus Omnitrophota bacterium]
MALKPNDIRNMTAAEINNKLISLKEALFKFRFEQKSGRVEKPHQMRQTRREIARCYTILREKENAEK